MTILFQSFSVSHSSVVTIVIETTMHTVSVLFVHSKSYRVCTTDCTPNSVLKKKLVILKLIINTQLILCSSHSIMTFFCYLAMYTTQIFFILNVFNFWIPSYFPFLFFFCLIANHFRSIALMSTQASYRPKVMELCVETMPY